MRYSENASKQSLELIHGNETLERSDQYTAKSGVVSNAKDKDGGVVKVDVDKNDLIVKEFSLVADEDSSLCEKVGGFISIIDSS